MDNIYDSISCDITSYLSSSSVALLLANTLLVQPKAIVNSLLPSIQSFYQELQAGAQSSPKYAWLLVCSCVRCYFKARRKVCAPDQAASNISSQLNRAGANLWAIAQSYRFCRVFISHHSREHPGVSGVINYHFFRFMVPKRS